MPVAAKMLELALSHLGLAARQLEAIDTETRKALLAMLVRAIASGDANGYIRERLKFIEDNAHEFSVRDVGAKAPPPPPPPPRRSSRPPPPRTSSRRSEPEVIDVDGEEGSRWSRRR